jgi:uncharacterized membrane protein YgdD (TMEM256/DUF423 family)
MSSSMIRVRGIAAHCNTLAKTGPSLQAAVMVLVFWGALSGFLAVALGAFGAHALRDRVAPDLLAVFETGARYHLVHAVAIVALAFAQDRLPAVRVTCVLFLAGTLFFSGSLYLLAVTGARAWGAVTPIGGVLFLAGWAWLAWAAFVRMSA